MRLLQESMRVEGRDLQAMIFSIKGIDQRRSRRANPLGDDFLDRASWL